MESFSAVSDRSSLVLFALVGAVILLAVVGLAFLLVGRRRLRADESPMVTPRAARPSPPAPQASAGGSPPEVVRAIAATAALNGDPLPSPTPVPEAVSAAAETGPRVGVVTARLAAAITWRVAWASHVGNVRKLNEDSLLALNLDLVSQRGHNPLGLFVVADGMGGQAAGEVASQTAVKALAHAMLQQLVTPVLADSEPAEAMLRAACQQANKAVYALSREQRNDMGTTCVAALVRNGVVCVANVGDSRAYVVDEASIRQITVDHSLVERLVAKGQITREEARVHPDRNYIYRHLGERADVEIDTFSVQLHPQQWLLLCSDGLNSMIDDEAIRQAIVTAPTPDHACQALIDCALLAGGDDNVSVVVLHAA